MQRSLLMLIPTSRLQGASVNARDGTIGEVDDSFFDDQAWALRYLVVNTGSWLEQRQVLISPYAVTGAFRQPDTIDVGLTRAQVSNSPPVDTHQPVSRRHEMETLRHYAYPDYWDGGSMWAMHALPMVPLPSVDTSVAGARAAVPAEDVHLRSIAHVTGYDIQASDGSIGHVKDFVFDEESWAIRYLVVDTRNWWPGGRKVLVAVHWADTIDWAARTVAVALTREQVRAAPAFDVDTAIDRAYEQQLHEAYRRAGYWD